VAYFGEVKCMSCDLEDACLGGRMLEGVEGWL
jgi:hypothetical protein